MGINSSKNEIFGIISEEESDIKKSALRSSQTNLNQFRFHGISHLEKKPQTTTRYIYKKEIRSSNDINACSKDLTTISSDLQQFSNICSLLL